MLLLTDTLVAIRADTSDIGEFYDIILLYVIQELVINSNKPMYF